MSNIKQCHEIDAEIVGNDIQVVKIVLDPNETVIAEAGAMNYMEQDIEFETKLGDGSDADSGFLGKMWRAGKRKLTGESLFMTHFTNKGNERQTVAFSAPYPGQIIEIDLSTISDGRVVCQKDAFLCAAKGTKVDLHLNKKLTSGFFGGEGFIMQKLEGDDKVYLHAGGCIIKHELNGQKLKVDTGSLVGFTGDVEMSIEKAGGLKSMVLGGEGLFLTTLEGTGTVYTQSMPFSRLADRIIYASSASTGSGGGGLVDAIGDMVD